MQLVVVEACVVQMKSGGSWSMRRRNAARWISEQPPTFWNGFSARHGLKHR